MALVVVVFHLLPRAVAVGSVDLGEEVVDNVVGVLEDAVREGPAASCLLPAMILLGKRESKK